MMVVQLLSELGHPFDPASPLPVYEDNQVAQRMAEEVATKRSKHVDLRYHYVRDLASRSRIKIIYCPTAEQLADIFTKALPRETFCRLRDRFMAKGEC